VAGDRLLAATLLDAVEARAQVGDERFHLLAILTEVVSGRVDLAL
jgi:hypothetical protein